MRVIIETRFASSRRRHGHRASWLNVGYCFDVGLGVRRSRERALFWYRKAAKKGDGAAANSIGTA
jgi:TPR repeat protein